MASPAPESLQANGISTPPATTTSTAAPTQAPAANTTTALPPTSSLDNGTSKRPRDARLIHMILANMGVHIYTERVPLQLLDFAYRYTSSILSDAQSYEPPASAAAPGSKKRKAAADNEGGDDVVGLPALRTAVSARAAGQFSATLPKEFMGEVASERNRVALPRVEREFGVRLPPERYCFTGVGWGVRERWEEEEEEVVDEVGEEDGMQVDEVVGFGGPVGGDEEMGGMGEEEEFDEGEFEEAMGN
jgi:transcription initiation factor TFIID subunit 9B